LGSGVGGVRVYVGARVLLPRRCIEHDTVLGWELLPGFQRIGTAAVPSRIIPGPGRRDGMPAVRHGDDGGGDGVCCVPPASGGRGLCCRREGLQRLEGD
jgi:hypothetical protein